MILTDSLTPLGPEPSRPAQKGKKSGRPAGFFVAFFYIFRTSGGGPKTPLRRSAFKIREFVLSRRSSKRRLSLARAPLFMMLFHIFPDAVKGADADNVLDPAGVLLRDVRLHSQRFDQELLD